jgi:hypothetical protein
MESNAPSTTLAEPSTPKQPTKRGRPAFKKTPVTDHDAAPKLSAKKRAATQTAGGEASTKRLRATTTTKPIKAGGVGKTPFPTCWEEFGEDDRLIVTMRRAKSSWSEIEAAWEKLTSNKPGKDVIRKKYAKLEAIATIFAPGDVSLAKFPTLSSLIE